MNLVEAIQKRIPSKEAWAKMPKQVAAKLKPMRKERVAKEFAKWVKVMGYEPMMHSAMVRTLMFEAFAAGWGTRARLSPSKSSDKAMSLLEKAAPHVYRQQHAGRHEQDKIDAKELYPVISKALKARK